jgi:hypothetical protein
MRFGQKLPKTHPPDLGRKKISKHIELYKEKPLFESIRSKNKKTATIWSIK